MINIVEKVFQVENHDYFLAINKVSKNVTDQNFNFAFFQKLLSQLTDLFTVLMYS